MCSSDLERYGISHKTIDRAGNRVAFMSDKNMEELMGDIISTKEESFPSHLMLADGSEDIRIEMSGLLRLLLKSFGTDIIKGKLPELADIIKKICEAKEAVPTAKDHCSEPPEEELLILQEDEADKADEAVAKGSDYQIVEES